MLTGEAEEVKPALVAIRHELKNWCCITPGCVPGHRWWDNVLPSPECAVTGGGHENSDPATAPSPRPPGFAPQCAHPRDKNGPASGHAWDGLGWYRRVNDGGRPTKAPWSVPLAALHRRQARARLSAFVGPRCLRLRMWSTWKVKCASSWWMRQYSQRLQARSKMRRRNLTETVSFMQPTLRENGF